MSFGLFELALILVVVVLLFGTGKLTRAVGDLARGAKAFRAEMKDEPESPPAPPVLPRSLAPPSPAAGPAPDAQPDDAGKARS
jgi:sec-independent protein translocase protein TatA